MKTIAFFNTKGGTGKTTLVYHLGHMLPRVGYPTLLVDLDPQANLTTTFFSEERIEQIWESPGGVAPALRRHLAAEAAGQAPWPMPIVVGEDLHVLPASLELGGLEADLAENWSRTIQGDTAAIRHLLIDSSRAVGAEVCLVDLGPALSALNRAALLGCDHFLIPLQADLFSVRDLKQVGPALRHWRRQFEDASHERSAGGGSASLPPEGAMQPIGYVIVERPAWRAGQKWIDEIPRVYAQEILGREEAPRSPDDDASCLAVLHSHRSLISLAQEARKPVFDLKPADGALGSYAPLVMRAHQEFRALAERIVSAAGLSHSSQP